MSLEKTMSVSTAIEADKNKTNHKNIISKSYEKSSANCKFYEIDIFEQAKEMLNIKQILEYYGLSVNSKGSSLPARFIGKIRHLSRYMTTVSTASAATRVAQ